MTHRPALAGIDTAHQSYHPERRDKTQIRQEAIHNEQRIRREMDAARVELAELEQELARIEKAGRGEQGGGWGEARRMSANAARGELEKARAEMKALKVEVSPRMRLGGWR